jgi:hypothetical protein
MPERHEQPGEDRPVGADGLPIIRMDADYFERSARRIEEMTGRLPLWYQSTPEERAQHIVDWSEDLRRMFEEQGLDAPSIPLEFLRREHIYD